MPNLRWLKGKISSVIGFDARRRAYLFRKAEAQPIEKVGGTSEIDELEKLEKQYTGDVAVSGNVPLPQLRFLAELPGFSPAR